jgi:hypothetical protein
LLDDVVAALMKGSDDGGAVTVAMGGERRSSETLKKRIENENYALINYCCCCILKLVIVKIRKRLCVDVWLCGKVKIWWWLMMTMLIAVHNVINLPHTLIKSKLIFFNLFLSMFVLSLKKINLFFVFFENGCKIVFQNIISFFIFIFFKLKTNFDII